MDEEATVVDQGNEIWMSLCLGKLSNAYAFWLGHQSEKIEIMNSWINEFADKVKGEEYVEEWRELSIRRSVEHNEQG